MSSPSVQSQSPNETTCERSQGCTEHIRSLQHDPLVADLKPKLHIHTIKREDLRSFELNRGLPLA